MKRSVTLTVVLLLASLGILATFAEGQGVISRQVRPRSPEQPQVNPENPFEEPGSPETPGIADRGLGRTRLPTPTRFEQE